MERLSYRIFHSQNFRIILRTGVNKNHFHIGKYRATASIDSCTFTFIKEAQKGGGGEGNKYYFLN